MSLFLNNNMNNSWIGLMQNGLSSLGMSGYSNFGGMNLNSFGTSIFGMNNNIFTNCYGQVDYDSLAGYSVANALVGVAGQAINHYASQSEPKVDHKQEAKDLKSEISQKELKHAELTTERLSREGAIKSAQDTSKNLEGQINSKQSAVSDLKSQYDTKIGEAVAETDPTKKAELQKEAAKLNNQKQTAEGELRKLQEKKAEQDKIVTEKSEELETCNKNIARVEKEIENLTAELNEHQSEVDKSVLKKADGIRLTRTPDDEYAKKLDNGKLKADESYTKSDMRTAINQFMNEANGTDAKLAKAHIICDMQNVLPDEDKSDIFASAAEIAKKYIDDNTSNKA